MSEYNERKLLRRLQAMSQIEPDLESTERAMANAKKAIMELKAEATPPKRLFGIGSARRLLAYSAAAVILIAIGFAVALMWKGRDGKNTREVVKQPGLLKDGAAIVVPALKKKTKGDSPRIESDEPTSDIEQELRMILVLARAGDVDGLIRVLHEGEFAGKLVAASYLMEVGDARAIAPLEQLSTEWYGLDEVNPFAIAVKAIKSRIAKETVDEPKEITPSDDGDAVLAAAGLKRTGVLCGIITDGQTGEPVAQARLKISRRRVYELQTDTGGFYHLDEIEDDGNYRIRISSTEYLGPDETASVALRRDGQAVRHFELKPGCRLDAHVVNDANEPLADVILVATWLGDEGAEACEGQKTDDNGYARLGAIKPSEIAYLITAQRDDLAPAKHIVKASDPAQIVRAAVVMQKGMEIEGFAEYLDGVPAGDLRISAAPQWWHSYDVPPMYQIDSEGSFVLANIVPGMYKLQVHIPHGHGSLGLVLGEVELPPADGLVQVTIPRKSPGSLVSISGRVIFVGDKRPDYVAVETYSAVGSHQTIVAADGTFRIDSLEPGVYTLRFSGPNMADVTVENVRAPADDVEVEIQYALKPKISGTVLDAATGQPVEKFGVRLRKVKSLRGLPYVQSGDWSAFDSEKGVFEMELVGPGIYQAQVHAADYSPAWSEEINTDENAPVRIELTAGGTIKGEVIDAAGKGISGAKVIPLSLAGGTMIERDGTKAFVSEEGAVETVDGAFELKHIGQGLESIKVVHPDYSVAFQRDIEVRDNYLTGGIVVTLYKGSAVQGYVYDREGHPQPNVTLHVQDAGVYSPGTEYEKAGRLAMTTTDPNGFYRAEGLPSERMCYIKRGDMDKRNGVVCRAVVPADKKITRLDFGAGSVVSGQVMVDSRLLANSTMLLADPERSDSDVFKSYARTDAQGGFAFRGVPVGRHGVYMEQDGQRGAWFRITTVQFGADDVDLGIIELATSTIEVQVNADDPNQIPEDVTVYLQQGQGFTGARAGNVQKPSRQGAPYVIQDVLPGEYTVVAGRSDWVQGRKALTVGPSPDTIATAVTIPQGGAGVSGHYIGPSSGMVFLLANDGEVACYIDPDDAEAYRINDLPAGDYLVVNHLLGKTLPLLAFNIEEGEHKVVDLDMSGAPAADRAALHTQVVTDAGVPLSGARVWLEADGVLVDPVRNNSEGQFFVTQPGEYVINADYPALGRAERRIVMSANDITQPPRAETTIILRLTQQ